MSQLGRILTTSALAAGHGAVRLQLQPGPWPPSRRASAAASRARICSRSFTSFPDRHGGLRRRRAAGYHDARDARHTQGLRPLLCEPEPAGDRTARRGAANTEVFRRLAARLGSITVPARERRAAGAAGVRLDASPPARDRLRAARARGLRAARARRSLRAVRRGRLPTPSGKCELVSETLAALGRDPLAGYVPPARDRRARPSWRSAIPLAFISPPRTIPELDLLGAAGLRAARRRGERDPASGGRAGAGASARAACRIFNDRGSFLARARVSPAARPGLVVGLSIWWAKMCPAAATPTP